MKTSERGPFARLRWFCKDGSVFPPIEDPCESHDGGWMHGEWNDRARRLRAAGYYIANVFADIDAETFIESEEYHNVIAQMVIEQFLISVDDGWILHKARFYRGAFQEESERRGARRLLFKLAEDPAWITRDYLALRVGARLLPHGPTTNSISQIRRFSTSLAERDADFVPLRNKIHNKLENGDAELVRQAAGRSANRALASDYAQLAAVIDETFASRPAIDLLRNLANEARGYESLHRVAADGSARLASAARAANRFTLTAQLMASLRDQITSPNGPRLRVMILDASLALEDEHIKAAVGLQREFGETTRRQHIEWLEATIEAVYGVGLMSRRQLDAVREHFADIGKDRVALKTYKKSLDYFDLVSTWSNEWLRSYFAESVRRLAALEPLADRFIEDQLRASPLPTYSRVLDVLLRDANRLAGVRKNFFGRDVGTGLRALNPGLARGNLYVALRGDSRSHQPDGIYLLPETTSDLHPVAGILTAGEGNALSHVQLLARNLGIPNVVVGSTLIPALAKLERKPIILAVSAAGSVRLSEDHDDWNFLFPADNKPSETLIQPNLGKLDLRREDLIRLSRLRAYDSGRVVGPKAANLGELHHRFKGAVAEGLAIPFGAFRRLLELPFRNSGKSAFQWMTEEYRRVESMPTGSPGREEAAREMRRVIHWWIENADPGDRFRDRLRAKMNEVFGEDATYGVFVRSDTNVEDLPGFTGAGLNRTVPNVVGFGNILAAISRVWASPFAARAFAWRQSRMKQPEHVYAAVLLMRSVPVDKSGVLVTKDIDTGDRNWLSVAVNEGVGGAVEGQAAESLRINVESGRVRLMAQATARWRRRMNPAGGIDKIPASRSAFVLQTGEIDALIALYRDLPRRFPSIIDTNGQTMTVDVEFGFIGGKLMLFQIRPFLESDKARKSHYLNSLDAEMDDLSVINVDLSAVPAISH